MASRFILPFADVGSGISPSDGAKLEFFASGTSTQKDTFTDEALTTPNANPVIANGDGVFDDTDIFLPDGGRYKVTLRDKNNVQTWEADPVVGTPSANLSVKNFDTVALMVASTELEIGDIVETAGYLAKGDGGDNRYEVVAAATGTVDGGSFIDLATHQAKGLFPLDIYSFKQWGAAGDGVTDDAPEFNFALIFADGKNITMNAPNGTYLLSDKLSMGSDTTIKSGKSVTYKRNHNNTMLANDLGITGATVGFAGNGNISFIGGIWDGNSVAFFDGFNTFEIGYADKVTFKDVTVLDVVDAHGVDLSSSTNILVEDCKFLGFADAVPPARNFSEAIQLDPNTDLSFSFGGLDRTHNKNVTVRNCLFADNPDQVDSRFTSWPVGVGGHAGVNDRFQTNIVITDNNFDACPFAGVRIFKWKAATVADNVFTGCERNVHVTAVSFGTESAKDPDGTPSGQGQAGENTIIDGNQFVDTVSDGVFFPAPSFDTGEDFKWDNVIISNNNFDSNTTSNDGCDLQWIHNLVISDNNYLNYSRGIQIQFCDNVSISGNVAEDITNEFIFAQESAPSSGEDKQNMNFSSDVAVTGNVMKEIGRTAINFSDNHNRISVVGNKMTNVSTEAATRQGIQLSLGCNNAIISNNSVYDNAAAIKPAIGIDITSACSDVAVTDNYIDPAIPELIDHSGTGISYTAGLALSGSPEGVVTAPPGSTVYDTGGGAGTTLFVKESGTGNTGWIGK